MICSSYQKNRWDLYPDPYLAIRVIKCAVDLTIRFVVCTENRMVGLWPTREERPRLQGMYVVRNCGHCGLRYQSCISDFLGVNRNCCAVSGQGAERTKAKLVGCRCRCCRHKALVRSHGKRHDIYRNVDTSLATQP